MKLISTIPTILVATFTSQLLPPGRTIAAAGETTAVFAEDFAKTEVGKVPTGFLVLAGGFGVAEESGNKFLELPGAPLDSFGVLFGPNEKGGLSATARFLATKKGRKFPAFGLSLQGAGGYRLQVSAAKDKLEIFKGDLVRESVDYPWKSGVWTHLRIQVRAAADGKWIVEGKVWPDGAVEPKEWRISLPLDEEPTQGRPALWGNPFSGTPIRFDDLAVAPAH